MRIQYILHADFELPGIIEKWALQHGFSQSYCRPFEGNKLPKAGAFDLLIVMGGPQSTIHLNENPYLQEEIDLIREAIQAEKPVLGFCLGAQLIGTALGARTEQSPHKEIGVFPIELTREGIEDPLLKGLPGEFLVSHWHNDMPGLTPQAKVLASSKGCPKQIIRYSRLVYGFQCHPEITRQNMEAMIHNCAADLAAGTYVQTAKALMENDYDSINRKMILILDNFLTIAKTGPFQVQHSLR